MVIFCKYCLGAFKKLLWWRCTYQLENELMWHASLRSVSFNLLKSCNLNTHDEQFPLLRDKGRLHSGWLDYGRNLCGQMGQLVRFGNSVDCNLERKIWVHGRPGHVTDIRSLALDPLDGWVRVSQCLVRSVPLCFHAGCVPSTQNEWTETLSDDSGSYDVSQPYTY